ncbi:MAG TPA: hypothetical protein VGP93_07970 [Polyangiaceae bacterium]|nr:hypothetical protein [Polyangiaceae bacterium]
MSLSRLLDVGLRVAATGFLLGLTAYEHARGLRRKLLSKPS